jgi:hypothetical protein
VKKEVNMKLNSLTADEYEANGNHFDADLHFVESTLVAGTVRWIEALVQKYGAFILAHHIQEGPIPGMFSLELEFRKDAESQEAMRQCNKEYKKGPPKSPKVGYEQGRTHQRLLNRRFYRLPDGRPFLLIGKWDGQGNRLGKVQAGSVTSDGIIPLDNEVVQEEVLRRCPLIPREEEPFSF